MELRWRRGRNDDAVDRAAGELVQLAGESTVVCCKTQLVPVAGDYEICASSAPAGTMVSVGAPSV